MKHKHLSKVANINQLSIAMFWLNLDKKGVTISVNIIKGPVFITCTNSLHAPFY